MRKIYVTSMATEVSDWPGIISNWDTLLATNRKVIIRSLRLGIPHKYRAQIWALLAGSAQAKKMASFTYKSLLQEQTSCEWIIECDVPRTFPKRALRKVPNFYESLRNVLLAYSVIDREIGYVQGMNFIAGMFVLHQEEEDAFWSFYAIMTQWKNPYRDFFVRSFPKLRQMGELVDWMVEKKFPEIYRRLQAKNFTSILFIPQWFNTCFISAEFEPELNTFIFDQFLAYGIPPLLSFGMAMIALVQRQLAEDDTGLLGWLTNPGSAEFMHNRQRVNIEWGKQWITTAEYEGLLREMKKEKLAEI